MKKCPICEGFMPTDNVDVANHVALGFAVCSAKCHSEAYRLDGDQYELPLKLQAEPSWYRQIRSHIDDP